MKPRLLTAALIFAGAAATGVVLAGKPSSTSTAPSGKPQVVTSSKNQIQLTRVTPEYWRVTFHNPPYNIFGPETIPQLNEVVTQIETDPNVKVVVFDSDVPGFFLTHYDFVPPLKDTTSMPNGPTGLPPLPDMLVRLSRARWCRSLRSAAAPPASAASSRWPATCVSPAARRRSCRNGKSALHWFPVVGRCRACRD